MASLWESLKRAIMPAALEAPATFGPRLEKQAGRYVGQLVGESWNQWGRMNPSLNLNRLWPQPMSAVARAGLRTGAALGPAAGEVGRIVGWKPIAGIPLLGVGAELFHPSPITPESWFEKDMHDRWKRGDDPFRHSSWMEPIEQRRCLELMSAGYTPFQKYDEARRPFGFASEMAPDARLDASRHWIFPAEVITHSHVRPGMGRYGL